MSQLRGASSAAALGEVWREARLTRQELLLLNHGQFFGDLIDGWFDDLGVEDAISMIEGLPDDQLRLLALERHKDKMSENPTAFLRAAEALRSDSARQIRISLFAELGKSDPRIGLSLIENMGQGKVKEHSLASLFASWAANDISAAASGIQSMEFPEDQKAALGGVLSASEGHPEGFFTDLQSSGHISPEVLDSTARDYLSRLERRTGGDVDMFLALYEADPGLRVYGAQVVELLGRRDWAEFYSQLEIYREKGLVDLDRDAAVLARGLASSQPEMLLELFTSLGEEGSTAAAREAAEIWGRDPERQKYLVHLMNQLTNGAARAIVESSLVKKK